MQKKYLREHVHSAGYWISTSTALFVQMGKDTNLEYGEQHEEAWKLGGYGHMTRPIRNIERLNQFISNSFTLRSRSNPLVAIPVPRSYKQNLLMGSYFWVGSFPPTKNSVPPEGVYKITGTNRNARRIGCSSYSYDNFACPLILVWNIDIVIILM